jgi:hypothetical protein
MGAGTDEQQGRAWRHLRVNRFFRLGATFVVPFVAARVTLVAPVASMNSVIANMIC